MSNTVPAMNDDGESTSPSSAFPSLEWVAVQYLYSNCSLVVLLKCLPSVNHSYHTGLSTCFRILWLCLMFSCFFVDGPDSSLNHAFAVTGKSCQRRILMLKIGSSVNLLVTGFMVSHVLPPDLVSLKKHCAGSTAVASRLSSRS